MWQDAESFLFFLAIFWLLNSLQKRYFSTQELSLFLSTESSQSRATQIETSLIIVIFMLCVLTYIVSYKLFVNGVVTESSDANRDKSNNCDIYVMCLDVHCFLQTVLELNGCLAICISRGLIWQRARYLISSSMLFGTNRVVVITEYWSPNHSHHECH